MNLHELAREIEKVEHKLQHIRRRRNRAILEARKQGWSPNKIAAQAGISRAAVRQILEATQ